MSGKRVFLFVPCLDAVQKHNGYDSILALIFSFCASQPMDVTRSTIVKGLDVVHDSCQIYLANKASWPWIAETNRR
jgi:hypothetical protein